MRTAVFLLIVSSSALTAQTWKDYLNAGVRAAAARNYTQAEKLLVEAVQEVSHLGENDQHYGTTLNTLGLVYRQDEKYALAEEAFTHALRILLISAGTESTDVANVEYNLGGVQMDQGHYQAAVDTYEKALPTFEHWFGHEGAKTAQCFQGLGECYRRLNRLAEAEKYFKQAAAVREASAGIDSPELGETMNSLGLTYTAAGKYKEAESAFKLALSIREASLGLQSDPVRITLENYAAMLQKDNRPKEAARLTTLAQAIRETLPPAKP
jgi:tetratricopeptide (TPR) repeat protein